MSFPPADPFRPGRWTGHWIWAPRLEGSDRRVLFRRTLTLTEVPERVPFRITTDSRHVLCVNGVELARGPVRHGPRSLSYDHGDAAPALRPGLNVITVLARFYGHPTPWWEPSPATFTLGRGSMAAEFVLGDEVLGTDASWRCTVPAAWTPGRPKHQLVSQIPEVLDARLLDPAWTRPEYDDSSWEPAQLIEARAVVGGAPDSRPPSDPFGALLPRPIPPLTATVRQADVQAGAAPGEFRADFGDVVSGTLRLTLRGPSGSVVDGALVEVDSPIGRQTANSFRYTLRGGEAESFETADPVGGRHAVLSVTGAAELVRVEVVERLRPRPPGPFFECSDQRLTEIYAAGLRTVDLTAHDAYLDCPTREQRAWTGDSVVHQSVDLIANPDWSLARHHPKLAAQPRPDGLLGMVAAGDFASPALPSIPDWALHWIRSVHNLYRYTGDRALVADLLATVEGVLRWFVPFRGGDGLLHDVTGWVLIDWSPVQVTGASAALNALWARALADFAEMAAWLGDLGRAHWARDLHAGVAAGFEAFWDAGRGAYLDTLDIRSVSEHVAATAVCAGLVPGHRRAEVLRLLLDRAALFTRSPMGARGTDQDGPVSSEPVSTRALPDWDVERLVVGAQPFYRYVVHDALALLGAADRIAELCLDWAPMRHGAFRECWEGGSFCHGWSATPTRDLVTYVLGLTPAEPGYTKVRVAPRLGPLTWARGAVPTPHGLVTVEVRDGDLTVDSPVPYEVVR
ncbi:alpha-L-rhamnosidase C-terminal domain-containing protein [Nonomuraea sp. NPDC050328]|uniref:alpha-L-rhamnosidase-related protein n=1 Tax=Nonomuraea sp. NPDC050328 TaxID=3364361 RepID=UPI0037AC225F